MVTLHCTQRLLQRLQVKPVGARLPATGLLGDWTAHVIVLARKPVVLGVNERTRLAVLLPLKEARTLVPRFQKEVIGVLRTVGGDPEILRREEEAFQVIHLDRTWDRSTLGTINEFANLCRWRPELLEGKDGDLAALARYLHETMCLPIQGHPIDAVRELLRADVAP